MACCGVSSRSLDSATALNPRLNSTPSLLVLPAPQSCHRTQIDAGVREGARGLVRVKNVHCWGLRSWSEMGGLEPDFTVSSEFKFRLCHLSALCPWKLLPLWKKWLRTDLPHRPHVRSGEINVIMHIKCSAQGLGENKRSIKMKRLLSSGMSEV